MATHFVPTEEIQKLTIGSYEFLASKIDEAISKDAKKVFGDSIPNKVERIGTFGDHVLVAADDGRFAKVKYERANNGAIKIISAEEIKVPVYSEGNLSSYTMQEARSIVDSLLAHDVSQAESKLRALVPFVDEKLAATEDQILSSVIESIKADRPWKRLYRERAEQVKAFLGVELTKIEERKLPIKFAKLSETDAKEQEGYKDLVHADLAFMAEAIGGWLKTIEATESVKKDQPPVKPEDQPLVTTFLAFTEDLKRDLQSVKESVLESVRLVQSVPSLGKLYDALAEESFHYEVASHFASTMLEGLSKPK